MLSCGNAIVTHALLPSSKPAMSPMHLPTVPRVGADTIHGFRAISMFGCLVQGEDVKPEDIITHTVFSVSLNTAGWMTEGQPCVFPRLTPWDHEIGFSGNYVLNVSKALCFLN